VLCPASCTRRTAGGPYVNGLRVAGFTPSLSRGRSPRRSMWRYSPGRWVWWNAAAKSRVLRLEALPRSLPLGSQSCLFCVSRTHPRSKAGTVLVSHGSHRVRRFWATPKRRVQAATLRVGWLRSVGEIGAQRAVDQVR
jgi:hypothetical protein